MVVGLSATLFFTNHTSLRVLSITCTLKNNYLSRFAVLILLTSFLTSSFGCLSFLPNPDIVNIVNPSYNLFLTYFFMPSFIHRSLCTPNASRRNKWSS
ncbi:hypothetical protein F4804DRAFT_323754 [Jackrogersella minutella]|nr:hypothetical protein F4804DRAFT_323754 [Jackrogersella minutella]